MGMKEYMVWQNCQNGMRILCDSFDNERDAEEYKMILENCVELKGPFEITVREV